MYAEEEKKKKGKSKILRPSLEAGARDGGVEEVLVGLVVVVVAAWRDSRPSRPRRRERERQSRERWTSEKKAESKSNKVY